MGLLISPWSCIKWVCPPDFSSRLFVLTLTFPSPSKRLQQTKFFSQVLHQKNSRNRLPFVSSEIFLWVWWRCNCQATVLPQVTTRNISTQIKWANWIFLMNLFGRKKLHAPEALLHRKILPFYRIFFSFSGVLFDFIIKMAIFFTCKASSTSSNCILGPNPSTNCSNFVKVFVTSVFVSSKGHSRHFQTKKTTLFY